MAPYLLPLEANPKIVVKLDEVGQVLEQEVRFVLGNADDAFCEHGRYEDRLPAGDGMCSMPELRYAI